MKKPTKVQIKRDVAFWCAEHLEGLRVLGEDMGGHRCRHDDCKWCEQIDAEAKILIKRLHGKMGDHEPSLDEMNN